MGKLWTFGDSQTEGFSSENLWARNYVNWKGYTPKVFGEIIAEKLNLELKNFGLGGSDNYTIFETFCKNVKNIEDEDVVILGWSDTTRFRYAHKNNWYKFTADTRESNIEELPYDFIKLILVNRYEENLYSQEVNNWIELINYKRKNKVIHWCSFTNNIKCIRLHGYQTIYQETNGELIDLHYSEKGQYDLATKIIDLVKSGKNNFLI